MMKYYLLLSIMLFFRLNAQSFEKAMEKTDKSVKNFQINNKIPGISVSISYKDKLIYSKGFGVSNIETKEPIDPSKTKFRIASMTKSLTALTIGRLIEMDSIDINRSVYFYLKNLPKKKYDFTVKDVGGHLAGIIRVPTGERYDCENTYSQAKFYDSFENDNLLFEPKNR